MNKDIKNLYKLLLKNNGRRVRYIGKPNSQGIRVSETYSHRGILVGRYTNSAVYYILEKYSVK